MLNNFFSSFFFNESFLSSSFSISIKYFYTTYSSPIFPIRTIIVHARAYKIIVGRQSRDFKRNGRWNSCQRFSLITPIRRCNETFRKSSNRPARPFFRYRSLIYICTRNTLNYPDVWTSPPSGIIAFSRGFTGFDRILQFARVYIYIKIPLIAARSANFEILISN